jgi:single-strand DNA-binding protein
MAGSVNRVILVGNLGQDPTVVNGKHGDFVDMSIATSMSWRDKATGERVERTEWHKVRVFQERLVKFAGERLKKGMKVYVEGQQMTRTYDKDGQKHWITETVLNGFNCKLEALQALGDGGRENASPDDYGSAGGDAGPSRRRVAAPPGKFGDDMDDDIPF